MTCFVAFFVLYKIMYERATSNSAWPAKFQIISGTSTPIEKNGMTCFVAFFVLYKIMYGQATSNSAQFWRYGRLNRGGFGAGLGRAFVQ